MEYQVTIRTSHAKEIQEFLSELSAALPFIPTNALHARYSGIGSTVYFSYYTDDYFLQAEKFAEKDTEQDDDLVPDAHATVAWRLTVRLHKLPAYVPSHALLCAQHDFVGDTLQEAVAAMRHEIALIFTELRAYTKNLEDTLAVLQSTPNS